MYLLKLAEWLVSLNFSLVNKTFKGPVLRNHVHHKFNNIFFLIFYSPRSHHVFDFSIKHVFMFLFVYFNWFIYFLRLLRSLFYISLLLSIPVSLYWFWNSWWSSERLLVRITLCWDCSWLVRSGRDGICIGIQRRFMQWIVSEEVIKIDSILTRLIAFLLINLIGYCWPIRSDKFRVSSNNPIIIHTNLIWSRLWTFLHDWSFGPCFIRQLYPNFLIYIEFITFIRISIVISFGFILLLLKFFT